MHIKIDRQVLSSKLALLAGVIERKATIPILANVLLRTNGQRLELAATDLERALSGAAAAEVIEGGAITVPVKKLRDYVSLLADGQVVISTDDRNWVTVKAGRSRARIPGIGVENFPDIPSADGAPSFTAPAGDVLGLFARVRHAISREESRFALNAALLEVAEDSMMAVATDGHRLAWSRIPLKDGIDLRGVIPPSAMDSAEKLGDGEMTVAMNDSNWFFAVGEHKLACRRASVSFPAYAEILPKYESSVTLGRKGFMATINRVAQFGPIIRLAFDGSGLNLAGSAVGVGDSSEMLECAWAGDPLELGFTASYLTDALSACGTEQVRLFLKDGKSMAEIRPAEGDGCRMLVMPHR